MQAVMTMNIKTYSELITLPTFEERFCYLKLDGSVGKETFGFKRWLNQEFYHSDMDETGVTETHRGMFAIGG